MLVSWTDHSITALWNRGFTATPGARLLFHGLQLYIIIFATLPSQCVHPNYLSF